MKKNSVILLAASLFAAAPLFADDAVLSSLDTLTEHLGNDIVENTVQLSVWPEAYIGNFLPSVPPHFGAGASLATTFISTDALSDSVDAIVNTMQASGVAGFSIPKYLPLPSYSFNARLGGFFLPFDMGVFGSFADINGMKFSDVSLSYKEFTIGTDARYAVLEGNAILPKISLGVGYIYSRQTLGVDISENYNGTYVYDGTNSITGTVASSSTAGITVNMNTIYFQAQVSKKLLFMIPYAGARAVFTSFSNTYDYSSTVNSTGTDSSTSAQETKTTTTSGSGSQSSNLFDFSRIQPQLFAGIGFNAPFSQFSLNVCFNPRNMLWSGSLSAFFKM